MTRTVTRTVNNNNSVNNKQQAQRQLNSNSKNSKTRTTTASTTTDLQHAEEEEEEEEERQQTNQELSLSDYPRSKRYDREPNRTFLWLLHSRCEVAVSSGQMAQTRKCTVPSRPAPTGWEWQETDAGTRVK